MATGAEEGAAASRESSEAASTEASLLMFKVAEAKAEVARLGGHADRSEDAQRAANEHAAAVKVQVTSLEAKVEQANKVSGILFAKSSRDLADITDKKRCSSRRKRGRRASATSLSQPPQPATSLNERHFRIYLFKLVNLHHPTPKKHNHERQQLP